jgi:hypothetical protein
MGRPFKYTVEQLKDLYEQYKVDRAKQFDVKYDCIKSGERAGETIEIKLPKVQTIASFCHFIGITEKSFYNWINEDSYKIDKEFLQFVTRVQEDIKDFQLSGAINNVYNPNIVARMNGIKDQIDVTSTEQPNINISIGNDVMSLKRN